MLRKKVKRLGEWTEIPQGVRVAVSRDTCQVCGAAYGQFEHTTWFSGGAEKERLTIKIQHLDHLLPRRWLMHYNIYPHQPGNLLSVCGHCHGKKKKLEDRLLQGDVLSYLQGLKEAGFPLVKVINFAAANGLREFQGWNL